tara:strand:+ start:3661 stop:4275 length:615 start_codon:yes stop_codon:yes gene_type:complete
MYDDKLPDMSSAYAEIQEKMKKKLDAVGKEDGDVDNDGDKDSSDSYLANRRKVIGSKLKKEHHQKDENGKVIEHDGEDLDEAMVVTNADKKGNTPAYQNFKKGMKSKTTGKPMYKAADHMKEEEIHPDDNALSPEELEKVAQLSRDWDAKMEEGYGGKPMMSKGGEVKPPRTAKGAMAYDGPNKAASEARDRLVAKTKAMREKK